MNKRSRNKARTEYFDLMIEGRQIAVSATPYLINGLETRFRVSYSGSPVYIFGLDSETHQVKLIDSSMMPPVQIRDAIAARLEKMENRRAA